MAITVNTTLNNTPVIRMDMFVNDATHNKNMFSGVLINAPTVVSVTASLSAGLLIAMFHPLIYVALEIVYLVLYALTISFILQMKA